MNPWFFVLLAIILILFTWRIARDATQRLERENARLREELRRLRQEKKDAK